MISCSADGDDLLRIFLGGSFDARFFGCTLFFGGIAHHADFDIELLQTRFDVRQPAASLFAGFLRLLHGLLDGGSAVAEDPGKELASGPDDDGRNHHEIQHDAKPVRLPQAYVQ